MIVLQEVAITIDSWTALEHPDAWLVVIQEIDSDYHHGGGFSVSYLVHDYPLYLDCLEASNMEEAKAEAKEVVIRDLTEMQKAT